MSETDGLIKIRSIANYQFGKHIGEKLFPDEVKIVYSRNTGKIRHIYLEEELFATLRPTTGLFILTIPGAKRLMHEVGLTHYWVKIQEDAEPFVSKGRSAFAKHIINVDEEIRPNEEVIVINANREVLATGKALLSGTEMKSFNKGIAVHIRHGVAEKS
jgi:7-cyano-7-deazaguanine tRNA-ribosyltransferase